MLLPCFNRVLAVATGIAGALIALAETKGEGNWSLEIGPELVIIDGVMDHAADARLENDETERWASLINVEYQISDRWSLIAGFSELRDLKVSGAAGCSAPWLEPGHLCAAIVTPIRFNSDLQQYEFGLDRVIWRNDRIDLSVGVSGILSVVRNSEFAFVDRIFFPGYPTAQDDLNDRFVHDETQWDLGGRMGFTYKLAKNWAASARYRITQPPGRTLHHFGLGLGARF